LTPEAIEDICGKDDEHLRAYCFCCPALRTEEFQLLYTQPQDSEVMPVLSVKGKSAQDVFGECIIRKNKGPDFVRKAGPDLFHSEEELREFLTRAAGSATAHINYAEEEPSEAMSWLVNMPTDEDAGWNAAASDNAIREEIAAATAASGSTLPPPIPPTAASLAVSVADADQAVTLR
jgi:hypothetical protein